MFKFGDNKMIKSNRCVKIPVKIAETPVILSTDVIDYDIPLLLSQEAMKKAKTQIDFCEDKVHIFGRKIDINPFRSRFFFADAASLQIFS